MLNYILQFILWGLPLNQYQILITHPLCPSKMITWTNSWNYSNHSMAMIFWVCTSRCCRFELWLLQIQLCWFIKMEEKFCIRIILCHFTNCSIIHHMRPVYNCPGQPSNNISSIPLKCYAAFQNLISEPLEHYYFVEPQSFS